MGASGLANTLMCWGGGGLRGGMEALCQPDTPSPNSLFYAPLPSGCSWVAFFVKTKQNKKPVAANRVLSWVLQIILVSYQTWWGGKGCENRQIVVSWAEVGITWGPLLCWYLKWGRSHGNESLICGIRCYLQVPWNWIELTPSWCHRIGVLVWKNDAYLVSEKNHAFGPRSGVRKKKKSQCRMLSRKKAERSKPMCLDLPIFSQWNSDRVD